MTTHTPTPTEQPPTLIDIEWPESLVAEDPERDRLAAEFRTHTATLRAIQARPADLRTLIATLTDEYVEADQRRRKALLAERTTLAAELTLLPAEAERAAQKYASALLAWVRHVYPKARAANDALVDELNPLLAISHRLQQSIHVVECTPDEERLADLQAERHTHGQQLTPIHKHRQEVLAFLHQLNGMFSQAFGAHGSHGTANENDVLRWVANVRKAFERACA